MILTGKDKGKSGEVLFAFPKTNKVLVAGRNIVKKHQKARRQGEKGQVIDREMPIHVSNVRLASAEPKVKAEPKAKVAKVAKAKTAKK